MSETQHSLIHQDIRSKFIDYAFFYYVVVEDTDGVSKFTLTIGKELSPVKVRNHRASVRNLIVLFFKRLKGIFINLFRNSKSSKELLHEL